MTFTQIIEIIIAVIGGVGSLVVMGGYAMGQYSKGKNNRRKDDIELKKDAFGLLQEQVDSLGKLCTKQQEEIIILRTQAEEREKKAREYIEIFQNRNPEMEKFISDMRAHTVTGAAYMKDTGLTLTGMKDILSEMTTLLRTINKENRE